MSGSIRLHPTLGVNPRLTFCPRCGGEGKDLVLAGTRNFKDICRNCGTVCYGGWDAGHCPKCRGGSKDRKELDEHEKLPSSVLCDTCQAEVDLHKKIVEEEGGVFFKCEQCGCTGVIKGHTDLAKDVRVHMQAQEAKKTGVTPEGWWTEASHEGRYLPLGIALDKCEQHTVAPAPV